MARGSRKRGKKVDYRERWPTVQTLIERSQLSSFESHNQTSRRRSLRVKALDAIAAPLLWMNIKLEEWQDEIDHRVELIQSRQEERSNPSNETGTTRSGILVPEPKRGKPGKSTHPYDTVTGQTPGARQDDRGSTEQEEPAKPAVERKRSLIDLLRKPAKPKATPTRVRDSPASNATVHRSTPVEQMGSQSQPASRAGGKIAFH
ncbi:hypothetical protein F4778DRAFT_562470 [Xylariomycetidae sp. FL2044]|nr:hypothetical protein F4778DRAFT_562470 [Xylariomycetidae sp. FL2044]